MKEKRYRIWSLKRFKSDKIVLDDLTKEQLDSLINNNYVYCHAWEEYEIEI
jgi:hypothetical protein